MKAIIRASDSTYETGDVITFVDDSHVFGSRDLLAGQRIAVDMPTLTDAEMSYLTMEDKQFKNTSAISQIPAFRHSLFKDRHMKLVKRRKYKRDAQNKPVLK